MGNANSFRTDLYSLFNYIQNTSIVHPKEVFIESLRDFFSRDSYYHFVKDQWGFPKTPEQVNLSLDAGFNDDSSTRIFIGEPYRYDVIYYPAVLVRFSNNRFVPVSFNNDKDVVHYNVTRFVDGYGNESFVSVPSYIVNSGAWEGAINIDIETKSHRSRDELAELISLYFIDTQRWELQNQGVFVIGTNVGSFSEIDDRTDKIFKATVTVDIRTEWSRKIPIKNIIDAINICIDFVDFKKPAQKAPNIRINSNVNLIDVLTETI